MKKCKAFVLSGGGARGALQVGALRALLEAGYEPDLLIGSSIGAVNAAGLAFYGADLNGIRELECAFQEIAESNIMDPHLGRTVLRVLAGRTDQHNNQKIKEFCISKGISEEMRFREITGVRLAVIGADLDTGEPIIYGENPNDFILEGLLASTALPPWFSPVQKNGHEIMDGGALSNLPIEPAIRLGATEIIALDINHHNGMFGIENQTNQYVEKLISAVIKRHTRLELDLARSMNIPVYYLNLTSDPAVPIWDFSTHQELFKTGYEAMCRVLPNWLEDEFQRQKIQYPPMIVKKSPLQPRF